MEKATDHKVETDGQHGGVKPGVGDGGKKPEPNLDSQVGQGAHTAEPVKP